jgi:hypothetical protein
MPWSFKNCIERKPNKKKKGWGHKLITNEGVKETDSNGPRLFAWGFASEASSAFHGAWYHMDRVSEVRKQAESSSSQVSEAILSWEIRAFFWELYSVSDLMLHYANENCARGMRKREVKWATLRDGWRASSGTSG